jgi:hypothetical protein
MMANPNSSYRFECALNRVIDRAFKVLDKMEEMRKARKFIEQTSPPPVTTGIWYNPIYPYQYGIDLSVEEAQRRAAAREEARFNSYVHDLMFNNEPPYKKVWEKDTYNRDPAHVAKWCAENGIQYLRTLGNFNCWWDDITNARKDEIKKEMADWMVGSIAPKPVETVINNPTAKVAETVWVPAKMMPEGMCCLANTWYDYLEGITKYQILVDDIERWLKKTALKMANREFVGGPDKNRFKDLAKLINWGNR